MNDYTLVTDGAFSRNRNQGGVGIVFLKDGEIIKTYSKMFKNCTNNQMELLAIILGLKAIVKPIYTLHIVSDSQYALGTMFQGWKRKKNQKLLEIFDKEYERVKGLCHKITYEHIRGHAKGGWNKWNKYNDMADKLALNASRQV